VYPSRVTMLGGSGCCCCCWSAASIPDTTIRDAAAAIQPALREIGAIFAPW
jgi:hypothetical protein